MSPINKEFVWPATLPPRKLLPHMQAQLDKELGETEQKTQSIFVPTIGGGWKVKK